MLSMQSPGLKLASSTTAAQGSALHEQLRTRRHPRCDELGAEVTVEVAAGSSLSEGARMVSAVRAFNVQCSLTIMTFYNGRPSGIQSSLCP